MRKCHAMLFLRTCMARPKMDSMDVILTISFKITAEIEIRKHMLYFADEVYQLCKACYFIHLLP